MSAVLTPGRAAALPDRTRHAGSDEGEAAESTSFEANRGWEIDRALMLERSERRAWWVALAGLNHDGDLDHAAQRSLHEHGGDTDQPQDETG